MGEETEVKIKIDSKELISSKLTEAGLSKVHDYHERNIVIDKDGKMKDSDKLLRLRTMDDGKSDEVFTYKGSRSGDLKTREEIEFSIDIEKLSKVFDRLGYSTAFKYEKKRQVWKGDKLEVVIDELPYLGLFIEIEGGEEDIVDLLEELGLSSKEKITETYLELFESYKEENEVESDFLVWENFDIEDM